MRVSLGDIVYYVLPDGSYRPAMIVGIPQDPDGLFDLVVFCKPSDPHPLVMPTEAVYDPAEPVVGAFNVVKF